MIYNQPECAECGGVCCLPERLEVPVPSEYAPHSLSFKDADVTLRNMGFVDARALGLRTDEQGRVLIQTECLRMGKCDQHTRPRCCLSFPLHYFDDDHTDAERAEIRPFCALFRRLEGSQ